MEAHELHLNISKTEHLLPEDPDLHVVIIVGLVLIILFVLAAILMVRYVPRRINSWREQRAEEALERAINIYNSQEPLEEPDLVYIRPGDQSEYQSAKNHRRNPEIAFVHSDGHIERFRTHIHGRDSSIIRTKHTHKPATRLHSNEPHYCNTANDQAIQPLCVKLEPISAQCFDADHGESVSIGGCDMPPPYEEALEMPTANVDGAQNNNRRDMAVGGKLEVDYYNIEIGQQSRRRESKDVIASESDRALLPSRTTDGHF